MRVRELIELLEELHVDQEAQVLLKIGRRVRIVSGVNTNSLGQTQICAYPHKEDE